MAEEFSTDRLFVHNLKPGVEEELLKEKFSKYGEIVEIFAMKNKPFAYVQFTKPEDAKMAKSSEDNSELDGRKISVSFAKKRTEKKEPTTTEEPNDKDQQNGEKKSLLGSWEPWTGDNARGKDQNMPQQNHGYQQGRGRGFGGRGRDWESQQGFREDRGGGGGGGGGYGGFGRGRGHDVGYSDNRDFSSRFGGQQDSGQRGGSYQEDRGYGSYGGQGSDSSQRSGSFMRDRSYGGYRGDSGPTSTYKSESSFLSGQSGMGYQASSSMQDRLFTSSAPSSMPPGRSPLVNDCEVIVQFKQQRFYAEDIEMRLKKLGMKVDLMFPREDFSLEKVLSDLASKGTLFAIYIQPINEEHRSLTVRVLTGSQEEHKNMPVDEGIRLIASKYQTTMPPGSFHEQSKSEPPPRQQESNIVPSSIRPILQYLLNDRPLLEKEYDAVIAYLTERKNKDFHKNKMPDYSRPPTDMPPLLETPSLKRTASPYSSYPPEPKIRNIDTYKSPLMDSTHDHLRSTGQPSRFGSSYSSSDYPPMFGSSGRMSSETRSPQDRPSGRPDDSFTAAENLNKILGTSSSGGISCPPPPYREGGSASGFSTRGELFPSASSSASGPPYGGSQGYMYKY